jgi:uncharacterized protein (UPF0210 family)
MVIQINPPLENRIKDEAARQGIPAETLAFNIMNERISIVPTNSTPASNSHDDWLKLLRSASSDCGTSLSAEAVSRENMYD